MIRKAVIINSAAQLRYAEKHFPEKDGYAYYFTDCLSFGLVSPGSAAKPYYNNDGICSSDLFENFSSCWYKDSHGRDAAACEGISLGQVLSNSAKIASATIIREWHNISRVLSECEEVYIPGSLSGLQKKAMISACNSRGKKCQTYRRRDPEDVFSNFTERKLGWYPSKGFRPLLKSICCNIFRRKKCTSRIVLINDWTYAPIAESVKDVSFISFNHMKAIASPGLRRQTASIFNILSCKLREILNDDRRWQRFEFLDTDCRRFIREYIWGTFISNRKKYEHSLNMFMQSFLDMKPDLFVFPSDRYDPYIIAAQAARKLGVKSLMLTDGYTVARPAIYEESTGYLFDYVAAFGPAMREDFEAMGIGRDKIVEMPAVFLGKYFDCHAGVKKYDAVVMTWIPNTDSPCSYHSRTPEYLEEVIELLKRMGMKNIAIKIKSSAEASYALQIASRFSGEADIDLMSGSFKDVCSFSDRFIGGISSAIAEVSFLNKKYFVYEPEDNGNWPAILASPAVYSRCSIAKTLPQLRVNIEMEKDALPGSALRFLGMGGRTKAEYYDGLSKAFLFLLSSFGMEGR